MNCIVKVYAEGFTGTAIHYRWSIRNAAGRIVAKSAESYSSKGGCERAIATLATMFEEGKIDGVPDWPSDTPEVKRTPKLDLVGR